jgi:hypothetical protein
VSTHKDSEVEVVRTRASGRGAVLWAALALPAVIVLVVVVAAGAERRQLLVFVAIASGLVALALRTWSMRRTSLELTVGILRYRGLFRTRVLSTPDAPASVVHVTLLDVPQQEGQIWFGPDGAVMLMTAAWNAGQLEELAQRLGCEVTRESEAMKVAELAKRYRGVVPWYGERPRMAAVLVSVLLIAIIYPFM